MLAVARANQNSMLLNYQTCYYFLNARPSPVFQLRSEDNFATLGQKLKSGMGMRDKDIDFEDDKDFSDAFVLEGKSRRAGERFVFTQVKGSFVDPRNIKKLGY